MELLEKKIDDEKFLNLIRKIVKAGYVEEWKYNETYSGTPQGGILTPTTKLQTFFSGSDSPWYESTLKTTLT